MRSIATAEFGLAARRCILAHHATVRSSPLNDGLNHAIVSLAYSVVPHRAESSSK
jgi:hypothetical protein